KMDGVSTNLALIFGTLLSSQGADASFVPVSRLSGRFLRFRLYQIFPIRFPRCFPVPFAFAPGPSGCFDFIRFISADLIGGFRDSNKNRDDSVESNSLPE
ncbi:hypothetical protein ACFU8I_40340, partial [Streptomyces sp. NPDC057540]|uniref:hypothetical protein n=1 Tax=Streptomyces sp. NPDC057540 TaxID=3346160 RepID=UPI00367C83FB